MWKDETIFSEGDLMNAVSENGIDDSSDYGKFISSEYDGAVWERLEHVRNMIIRLQAEVEVIKSIM